MAASKPQEKVTKTIAPLRVKVKFLKDCDPGNGKPVFKAGTIRELVISSANHWVRRGMAEKYVEKPKKVKPRAAKPRGRQRKVTVKTEPVAVESVPAGAGPVIEEEPDHETPEEEPAIEGKKTEDGESFGGLEGLMG
jgi:hypothetical protein